MDLFAPRSKGAAVANRIIVGVIGLGGVAIFLYGIWGSPSPRSVPVAADVAGLVVFVAMWAFVFVKSGQVRH